jgi:hypothetical protein
MAAMAGPKESATLGVFLSWWVVSLLSIVVPGAAGADRRLPDAAKKQDREAIDALLKQRADVNGRHPDGATALHWAGWAKPGSSS